MLVCFPTASLWPSGEVASGNQPFMRPTLIPCANPYQYRVSPTVEKLVNRCVRILAYYENTTLTIDILHTDNPSVLHRDSLFLFCPLASITSEDCRENSCGHLYQSLKRFVTETDQ